MTVSVRSFAKINLGLYIGALRVDGFHDLRTVYQTIAIHDVIRVKVGRGSGIEISCRNNDPRVPLDSSNTCYRMAERVLDELGVKSRVSIEIDKRLPVQGGLGAASANAISTMLGLERALRKKMSPAARLRIAEDIGSDLPLFLVGGTALGVGRGEEVYPLPDLPPLAMVVVMPEVGVSTPRAFASWDRLVGQDKARELRSVRLSDGVPSDHGAGSAANSGTPSRPTSQRLTHLGSSDRLIEVSRALSGWLTSSNFSGSPNTGAPAKGWSRAGNLLSDLVRTGIENDFEKVVFPEYPELRDIKGALERAGSKYSSLSGSGSTLYGLFGSRAEAAKAVIRLQKQGVRAIATSTLTRGSYWKRILDF
jgi:4-diphosphocytidyl-2-C-methyl-D-erythritol kinase